MRSLPLASAAFAALIVTGTAADARGLRGGGGFHGVRADGFHGYRGAVAGGYRGGHARVGRYGYGRYGYRRYGLAAAGVGAATAAAAAGYYGASSGGCGPYAYDDPLAGSCRPY